MTYNEQGKRIRSENLAGRIATKVAQGEGGLGLKTDMAYTVKHIQKGQALWADSWRGKTVDDGLAQIDMLIARADGMIVICEITYSEVPYELSKEEDAKIVRRLDSFRRVSRTRKSIRSILISASGLKQGKYSGNIMSVVTGEDLFAEV